MSNRIKTTTAFKAFTAKRANALKSATSGGGWEVRRVLKSGKLGAASIHFQTKQTEWSQDGAEKEAARLCLLNGEGSFKAVEM